MKIPYDKVALEDIHDLMLKFFDEISLKVEMKQEQVDELENNVWDFVEEELSRFFNYPDYRNYN